MSKRAILMVLDGFGIGKDSPFNAIKNAKMPFYTEICKKYPHSQLITHGEAVGLPSGIMGNSEVGHMTLGAGRIIYQDLTRISKAISTQEFFKNPILTQTLETGAKNGGCVHLMGLLSDGGVHSHIDHLFALLDLSMQLGIPRVSVHPFLDGRDTPPQSGEKYLKKLLTHPAFASGAKIGTLMGRFWAMDRDHRWDRVEQAYKTLTGQTNETNIPVLDALQKSYASNKMDEFVEPVLLSSANSMKDEDSVIFFNFRSDRAREMSQAITSEEFRDFDRGAGFKPSAFAGMTTYDKTLDRVAVAYPPQSFKNIFGEWIEKKNLKQLRIAETEKYAHVTFFFNGGREAPFRNEDRVLIPSVKDVLTYDLKPEMSAYGIADEASKKILENKYDFILMNFANADMVGHTGKLSSTIQAVEALDHCLGKVIGTAEKSGYHVLLTADHGNAEEMQDSEGRPHTQHTLNPVPAVWIQPNSAIAPQSSRTRLKDGSLCDVMPTLCDIMGLGTPEEATGESLIRD